MKIKASGRSAVILAAGLWLCVAGPMRAQDSAASPADPAATAAPDKPIELKKFNKHHGSKRAAAKSRKADKAASKETDKASDKAAADTAAKGDDAAAKIPPTVANANAQLPAETPGDMSAMAAQNDSLQKLMNNRDSAATAAPDDTTQIVAADQLNEVDRALSDDKPALTLARATIDSPPAVVVSGDNATWDKTSLIGKIFIAFGGLLTMASAARMFMA